MMLIPFFRVAGFSDIDLQAFEEDVPELGRRIR
jgi:hypothetical protein